jgi:hypothetical protein
MSAFWYNIAIRDLPRYSVCYWVIYKVQSNSNYPDAAYLDRLGPSGNCTFSYCICTTSTLGLKFFPQLSNT